MVKVREMIVAPNTRVGYGEGNARHRVAIHETGNRSAGADADAHGRLLARAGVGESWHYTVDDKEAVKSYPHSFMCWHAGDSRGPGNTGAIAVEICVNSDGDYGQAVRNAAELTARILREEGLTVADVAQHNAFSGKNCPERLRRGDVYTWAGFLDLVRAALAGKPAAPAKPKPPAAKPKPGKSVAALAAEVVAGKWGNDPERKRRLTAAGYNAAAVQAEANRLIAGESKPKPKPKPSAAPKSVAKLAAEVIAGKHGTGDARERSLGSAYAAVQAEVNRRLGASGGPDLGAVAAAVIRGDYGNGADRARRLAAAGYNADAVQAEVNRRLA